LGFDVEIHLPYKYIFNIARTLKVEPWRVKVSVALVNDMLLHGSLASRRPCSIAVTALQIAIKYPSSDGQAV
jgi:hypothetical protein